MQWYIFILAVSLYIISVAAAIFLMILKSEKWKKRLPKLITAHAVLLLLVVAFNLLARYDLIDLPIKQLVNIIFCSTGVAVSGAVLKSKMNLIIKLLYAVFASSFIIFVLSTSTLVSLIANFKPFSNSENRFALGNNYYLELQTSMLNNREIAPRYKLYKRIFYFNKTLMRDIDFTEKINRLNVNKLSGEDSVSLSVYTFGVKCDTTLLLKPVSTKLQIRQKRGKE
ncbi:MAG: hypothetical protein IPO27_17150 [Bacteroidetes bacterium]|nr:hypothetical protein [Bacteroidota bacterium]